MEKVTKPKVRTLARGSDLIAKQMEAEADDLLPKHLANIESILFIHEGECTLNLDGEDHLLKQGDAFIVPADVTHQIRVKTDDFKGVHFMPKKIEFEFFK